MRNPFTRCLPALNSYICKSKEYVREVNEGKFHNVPDTVVQGGFKHHASKCRRPPGRLLMTEPSASILRPPAFRLAFPCVLILVSLLAFWPVRGNGAEQVVAYNTYLGPPFLEQNGGLVRDLLALLNRRLAGEYQLRLENLPRARLVRDILSERSFNGAALLLHPHYINDPDRSKYL